MRLILAIALVVLAADSAFAQGTVAAPVDWSALITTTLNQLLVASGVAGGSAGVAVLYQIARALIAWRNQIEASTTNQTTTATTSLIDQVVQQGIAMIAGRMQVAAKGTAAKPVFRNRDVNDVVHFVRDTLQAHGLTLDSDVIRGKVHAVIGGALLKLPTVPATASPNPPVPTPPQAAAAAVMTGAAQ